LLWLEGVGQWSSWQRKVGFEGSSEEEGTTGRASRGPLPAVCYQLAKQTAWTMG